MTVNSTSYQSRILQTFGELALNGGLFYNYCQSLRVELSGIQPYIRMFLRAYERSKAILDFSVGDLDKISICLSFYGSKFLVGNLSIFRNLRSCEIGIPKTAEIWQQQEKCSDDPEWDLIRKFICFDIPYRDIDLFLWGLFASELGIRPRIICSLHIFSYDRQILFYPYDDRGMDIIGNDRALLKQIYLKFNDWLLDYNRQKMDGYFKNN